MFDPFYYFLNYVLGYTHPVHPTQVNMPIGLTVGTLILGIAGLIFRKEIFFRAARYTFFIAFLFIFPTIVAGIMDWQHFYGGVRLSPLSFKIPLAFLLFVFFLVGILVSRKKTVISAGILVIYAAACLTAITLGYFGGNIVFGGRAPKAPPEYRTGENVFLAHCTGCHPHGANILKPKMAIVASDKLDSLNRFVDWIRYPKKPMPPFPPTEIPNNQAKNLYGYLDYLWGGHGKEEEHGESKAQQ